MAMGALCQQCPAYECRARQNTSTALVAETIFRARSRWIGRHPLVWSTRANESSLVSPSLDVTGQFKVEASEPFQRRL